MNDNTLITIGFVGLITITAVQINSWVQIKKLKTQLEYCETVVKEK